MIKRKINNNKGSTLVMLLIILTILIMLGTVIMSLAVTNYKMKIVNSNSKRNFYFAEAGIDEAYGIIGEAVDEGISMGNEAVVTFMNEDLSKQNIEEAIDSMENGDFSNPYIVYLNEDGSLNMDEINKKQNQIFKATFKSYITSESNVFDGISEHSNYKIKSTKNNKPIVYCTPANPSFNEDVLEFTINSNFTEENIERRLSAKFNLIVPDYNSPYYSQTTVATVNRNVGWSKAIAAEGDLQANGGNITINGSVYVKGKSREFGGISTIGQNTNLVINGNVATQNNIQTASSNSQIDINGNAYAGNFRTKAKDQNGNKIIDSNLFIRKGADEKGGSLYTLDDLSLNAESSLIDIEDSYYGVSDGSHSSTHDSSSSIIINSNDIGLEGGSQLTIEGKAFIPGTSYITLLNPNKKYQTGESVSVKGNYRAYSYPLTENDPNTGEPPQTQDGHSLKQDNVEFEYYNPLFLVSQYYDSHSQAQDMKVIDKSKYFMAYEKEYEDNQLNLGGINGINIIHPEVTQNLGVLIHNNQVKDATSAIRILSGLEDVKPKYIIEANYMGVDESKISDGDLEFDKEKTVSYWVKFDDLPSPTMTPTIGTDRELVLLDRNIYTDYAIIGPNANSIPEGTVKIQLGSNDFLKGLIITKGNVYFCGDINFRGTVISNKDIIFFDSNNKHFTYDENYVAGLIINENLSDYFNDSYDDYIEITTNADIKEIGVASNIVRDKAIRLINWSIEK
ncbi:MAG: hypothetical protein FH761_10240 [Firmicutes bacterium]|nr:hypothetical protein [Bacillota bacterium]